MKTWQRLKGNAELLKRYATRSTVLGSIRRYFDAQDFVEVETPIVIPYPPAESYVEVFETRLLDRERNAYSAYLSTSPEIWIKKLLASGFGNCYCLTKSFRNQETGSSLHNPEFTLLEWYRVHATYFNLMEDAEDLILSICNYLGIKPALFRYQQKPVDLTKPWERMSVADAFERYADIDLGAFFDRKYAEETVKNRGYAVSEHTTWEEMYHQIFLNEIEMHLGTNEPTILYDYPSDMAALAKKKDTDNRFAERFELYIAGLELGDCYSELTDWKEQKRRFDAEIEKIKRSGKTMYEYDEDFIDALKEGIPECSGMALGVDRLIMLFSDVRTIQETLYFPADEMFGT